MKHAVHTLLLSLLPFMVFSQSITNYIFSSSSGTYPWSSDSVSTGAAGVDDGTYGQDVSIGFDFWYMATRYNTLRMSTNGWLRLGSGSLSSSQFTNNLSTGSNRPVIAPLWDDLQVNSSGDMSYQTYGTAPNRTCVIQFSRMEWSYAANADCITFQVILCETSGKIEFNYYLGAGALNAPGASIGITAAGTGAGNFLSLNGTGASPSASSSTETTTLNAKPANGQIYTFTPVCPTAPTALSFSGVTDKQMTISWTNNGSNRLLTAVYFSMDGTNYAYHGQTAAGSVSYAATGLMPGTAYYWKLYAVSEGCMAGPLSGSQATSALNTANYKVWNGSVSTAWTTAGNWTPSGVPVSTDDVYIPNTANKPNTGNNLISCRDLIIDPGVTLTISITGVFNYFDCYGNVINNGTINETGNKPFYMNGTNKILKGTGTFTNWWLYLWTGSSTNLGSNITCASFDQVADIYFGSYIFELTGGGGLTPARTYWQQGTLYLNSSVNNFAFDLQDDYYNVWFNNSAGTTKFGSSAKQIFIANNMWIKNPCTLNNSNAGPNTIHIGGDFTNDDIYNSTTATINMHGTKAQYIGGTSITTFYILQIKNSVSSGVTLNRDANVSNAMKLIQGPFFLDDHKLIIQPAANTAVTRTAGYVVSGNSAGENTSMLGRMQWNIGTDLTAHVFTFGTVSGIYIPFTFDGNSGILGNVTLATYKTGLNNEPVPPTVTNLGSYSNLNCSSASILSPVDNNCDATVDRFWQIDLTGSDLPNADITFTYSSSELPASPYNTPSNMLAQRWDGTVWAYPPPAGQIASAYTLTVPNVTTFSPWAISSGLSPLPVELLYFKAECSAGVPSGQGDKVIVEWETASEQNSDYFTLEKSADGNNFYFLAKVKAAGNSSTVRSYEFTDPLPNGEGWGGALYYRLSQTDFNGATETFTMVSVKGCGSDAITAFSNENNITILINSKEDNNYSIVLVDAQGKIILRKKEFFAAGNNTTSFSVNTENGIYILKLFNDKNSHVQKLSIQK